MTTLEGSHKHALGMSAGFSIGYGLTYQYWVKNFGVQVNFAPRITETQTNLTGGLSFFYKIVSAEHLSLFVYQGNSYWYEKRMHYSNPVISKNFNNGIGIGIEFLAIKRVSLSVMGGYAAMNNFEEFNLTGEVGLNFKF